MSLSLDYFCRVPHTPGVVFFPAHLLGRPALAALPCLSSAGPDTVRSRAEALFQRLSFLDGPGAAAARRGVGPGGLALRHKEESSRGDSSLWWWLPSVPAPPSGLEKGATSVARVSSRRPAGLLEGRAVFGGGAGRVAGECAAAGCG